MEKITIEPCPCDFEHCRDRHLNGMVKNLQRALDEALRLAPYGLPSFETARIRAMAEGTYTEPKPSEAARLLAEKKG